MMWQDDDEEHPTTGDTKWFTRAEHGKEERQEEKAEREGKLSALKRQVLRSGVEKKNLSAEEAGKKDTEEKRQEQARKAEEKKTAPFHTETLKEQEEKQVQTALSQDTPETLITKEEQRQLGTEQAKEEFQKEPG